jgi:hypothetical protein
MLVNLLIAMMGSTYGKVDKIAKNLWSVQYIDLLEEFRELLAIPPPFSFVYNLAAGISNAVNWVFGMCGICRRNNRVAPGDILQQHHLEHHHIIENVTKENAAHGIVYIEHIRAKDEEVFMEECCRRYLREEEDKDKLDNVKKEITSCVNIRFKEMDQLVRNIEFNVIEHTEKVNSIVKHIDGMTVHVEQTAEHVMAMLEHQNINAQKSEPDGPRQFGTDDDNDDDDDKQSA